MAGGLAEVALHHPGVGVGNRLCQRIAIAAQSVARVEVVGRTGDEGNPPASTSDQMPDHLTGGTVIVDRQ